MVMQLPEADDETSVSRRQLLAKLDVAMGGRVAEELICGEGDVTTGASSDLEQATRLARAMVTRYGMSDRIGQVTVPYDDGGAALSSETRAAVEAEVKRLLAAAHDRARGVLKAHEGELHALAKELLDKETLTGAQIVEVLARVKGGRPGGVAAPAG
jgi:ATP-dependent metalloprotease